MAIVGKVILPTYAQYVTSDRVKATFHTIRNDFVIKHPCKAWLVNCNWFVIFED